MPHVLFLALSALFSGFVLTLYSLAISHVNDKLEPAQTVAASSSLLRLNGAAAAAGPLLAGSLMAGLLRTGGVFRHARLADRGADDLRSMAQEPAPAGAQRT